MPSNAFSALAYLASIASLSGARTLKVSFHVRLRFRTRFNGLPVMVFVAMGCSSDSGRCQCGLQRRERRQQRLADADRDAEAVGLLGLGDDVIGAQVAVEL